MRPIWCCSFAFVVICVLLGCGQQESQPPAVRQKIALPAATPATTPAAAAVAQPAAEPVPVPSEASAETELQSAAGATLTHVYNGKNDPFLSFVKKDEPDILPQDSGPQKVKRIPQTPLERMDLSQLKLTGIIQGPNGLKALVEEATGRGYIVEKGTYVGIHGGQITEIRKDRILVSEEVENVLGVWETRVRVLKLQPDLGEEHGG